MKWSTIFGEMLSCYWQYKHEFIQITMSQKMDVLQFVKEKADACSHLCCRSPGGWWRWSGSGRSLCSSACSPPPVSSSPARWPSHTRPRCAQSAWTGPARTRHAPGALSAFIVRPKHTKKTTSEQINHILSYRESRDLAFKGTMATCTVTVQCEGQVSLW